MLWSEVRTRARWLAREHAALDASALLAAQWARALGWLWPQMWARHPDAFQCGEALVGSLPALPSPLLDASDLAALGLGAEWMDVLAVGLAWVALDGFVSAGEELERADRAERLAALRDRFEAGLFGVGGGRRG